MEITLHRFLSVIVLCCCAASLVAAQTATLRGSVSDSETGERMVGANIIPQPLDVSTGTTSGNDGVFELVVPPGTYTVTISYVGYTKKTIPDVVLKPDEVVWLSIVLIRTDIQLNPITVTASRRPEKVLDAPAAVNILLANDIAATPTLTIADLLTSVPGIDVARTGLTTSNVVVRGFNDLSTISLLSLTDNRITQLPSLRLNYYQMLPTTNDDIERMEVVSGPGSALYGPNSASGVLHVITKSPFGSEGTTVNVAGGERSVAFASMRHAGSTNNVVGYKFSGQYYKGIDWELMDPAEPPTIIKGRHTVAGRVNEGGPVPNVPDYQVEKISGDARVDVHVGEEATAVLAAGITRANSIDGTQIGRVQHLKLISNYIQGRFTYKDLFVQAYMNGSDGGDSYILRTGDLIVDNSKLFVAQVQHGFMLKDWQRFTYGIDALFTRPDTKTTINGRNEDNDNTNETGIYLQSETHLHSTLMFVGALRFDDHSRTKDNFLSPRVALVYKPQASHTFRVTFNRAFASPPNQTLFADILAGSAPMPAPLASILGPNIFDLRVEGTTPPGFSFHVGPDGRPQMVSLYGGLLTQAGVIPSPNSYLPPDVNAVWPALRQLTIASAPVSEQPRLNAVLPAQLSATVPATLASFNPGTQSFDPVDQSSVTNVPVVKQTITNTIEVGYKGLIDQKLLIAVDYYHSSIKDFIAPLAVANPNVFINPSSFIPVLVRDMVANGYSTDSATAIATNIANTLGRMPIGIVSPREVQNATDIILTYRNFGNVSLDGVDFSANYYHSPHWIFGVTYSFISKDLFPKSAEQPHDIALNAPQHKASASVQYRNQDARFEMAVRLRFVDGFPFASGVYAGSVHSFRELDLTAGCGLPFSPTTLLTVSVTNLLNEVHQEMLGVPKVGRLTIARLTQSF